MKLLLSLFIIVLLASCGSSYSPLDTHIEASIKSDSLNKVSQSEAQKFIDSINIK